MGSGKIVFGLLLFIVGLIVIGNFYQKQQQKIIGFEARLITASLFEDMPYQTGTEFIRLVYEYPRDQIPEGAKFFYVNITIPDNIANRLDQLVVEWQTVKDAFYPRVYAVKREEIQQNPPSPPIITYEFYKPYSINYVEFTPNGFPKKLQVAFKASDVPKEAKYLSVTIHVPFFEDFDDDPGYCFYNNGDTNGQWTAVKLEKPICIGRVYDRNVWTSWKMLKDQEGTEGWSVLMREIDMPIDPYKPLYAKWLVDYYETGSEPSNGGGQFVMGLEFELNDTSTYFVAFRAWYNNPNSGLEDYRTALQNVAIVDCVFTVDKNNEMIDLASYIRSNCNLDWNKVRKLKKVYIALRDETNQWGYYGEGHTMLSYLFIGLPK